MSEQGRLYGIGVGPGDPELLTLKARRLIESVDVVAFPTARHGRSIAQGIAAAHLRDDQVKLAMTYPVTTETTAHPGGYEAALSEFYDSWAATLAMHLDAGRDVGILCEGDPLFYGSYIYLHERLAPRYRTEVVPGVTSFSAAAASAGLPLARRDEVLSILPGTLPADALASRLATSDAAVVIKLGRNFSKVRDAARRAQVDGRAVFVERASSPDEHRAALTDVNEDAVPYMSLVLVPGRPDDASAEGGGRLAVVGLGPAGPDWLTPEAHAALAGADVLVGYGPYLARVPLRRGQERRASDNRVELVRAREALELALAGSSVAVVSSGDPGIFAMAAAVYEAIEEAGERFAALPVRVVAGVSAMQIAAARAGAPLGHDFCVISLSDQRKPWPVIEARLRAASSADLAIAVYNPASQTRREQLARARAVLLEQRAADTPVVLARAVGSDEESLTITTLAGFDLDAVDMRTLVLIGSSQTRVLHDANGAARVYTPRSYPG
ncbi:MAG TPA: precorrin-2 C(20)-methyltransferase [Gaiellales bacterium]|jgi:precorrin-2 C20-methyltransferase/precorrin-3B C17-methyltransferase|nr:precorrin-2 C(20)-methyltransferase [Gaiellales bacterium]